MYLFAMHVRALFFSLSEIIACFLNSSIRSDVGAGFIKYAGQLEEVPVYTRKFVASFPRSRYVAAVFVLVRFSMFHALLADLLSLF